MNSLRVALAQINVTVGAIRENADKIAAYGNRAAAGGAAVVVFPELALSGYPPEDLVLRPHFVDDCQTELQKLAFELMPELICIVGTPRRENGKILNSASILSNYGVKGFYDKILLPNYGVFDEQRLFAAGSRPVILTIGPHRIALQICEDSWHPQRPPTTLLKNLGINAVVNLSASPYQRGKLQLREEILGETAATVGAPLLYCNLVGGQDELVFDGASLAISTTNAIFARGASFREDLVFVDLWAVENDSTDFESSSKGTAQVFSFQERPLSRVQKGLPATTINTLGDTAEVYAALVTGLRDYAAKNGFQKVVVGVSGGIDSALVLAIAVDALGSENVVGITMPSQYSSQETISDAVALGRNLGVVFHIAPIGRLFQSYLEELAPFWKTGQGGVTEENLQARIRGNLIMAFSNEMGWLALTTGNKSEYATGYATLYGDMCGGFAVIKDVPKTLVFKLASWRNDQCSQPMIPPSIIDRPPSAELKPGQLDSDSLPPYDILDPILEAYIENDLVAHEIVDRGYDPLIVNRVIRLVDQSEYKRRQGPPGIKITPRAFGRDRRVPITNAYKTA